MRRRGFTLIELLVVMAILAILAAILFPVFARAKHAAKQTGCISNLSQVGKGIMLYMTDHDDMFPQAVDASDKFTPQIWDNHPEFKARIPDMPLMSEAIQPYVKSKEVWKCPGDNGSAVLDNHWPEPLVSNPTMHATFGMSYFFRTEIAFKYFSSTSFQLPANVNVLFDGAGHWHGSASRLEASDDVYAYVDKIRKFRYNTLYGDFHVKSLNYSQLQEAWATDL